MCFKRKATIIESFLLHSDIIITFTILGGSPVLLLELLEFFFHYIELKTASQKIPLFHPTKKINTTLDFFANALTVLLIVST